MPARQSRWSRDFTEWCYTRADGRTTVLEPHGSAGEGAGATLIWLHGLGESPNDKLLGRFVGDPAAALEKFVHGRLPQLRIVVPRARLRFVHFSGSTLPAWFDMEHRDAPGYPDSEDTQGIESAAEFVNSLVQAEIGSGTPAERIIVGGFSQGAALALHCACRVISEKLMAVISLQGWLPLCERVLHNEGMAIRSPPFIPHNLSTPILLHHSEQDHVVPFKFGKVCAGMLQEMGFTRCELKPLYNHRGHGYNVAHFDAVVPWLSSILQDPNPKDVEVALSSSSSQLGSELLYIPGEQSGWRTVPAATCTGCVDSAVVSTSSSWSDEERVRWLRILFDAGHIGDLETVTAILKAGVPVDKQDEHGNTLLHYAVKDQDFRSIAALWVLNADPNLVNQCGESAATIAAENMSSNDAGAFFTLLNPEPHSKTFNTLQQRGFDALAYRMMAQARMPWLYHSYVCQRTDTNGLPDHLGCVLFYIFYVGLHIFGIRAYDRYPESQLVPSVAVIHCMVAVMCLHIACVLSDPGYANPATAHKDVKPGAGMKYCVQCKDYMAKSEHHCRICRRCVLRRDHHCMWISNCVGKRNAAIFLSFYTVFLITCSSSLGALACSLWNEAYRYKTESLYYYITGWVVVGCGASIVVTFGRTCSSTVIAWSKGWTFHELASETRRSAKRKVSCASTTRGGPSDGLLRVPYHERPMQLLNVYRMLFGKDG